MCFITIVFRWVVVQRHRLKDEDACRSHRLCRVYDLICGLVEIRVCFIILIVISPTFLFFVGIPRLYPLPCRQVEVAKTQNRLGG